MYRAIIRVSIFSLKPSMDSRIPRAAITAPPGTPGAATIVMPSIRMKGSICAKVTSQPLSIMTAMEQLVRVMVEPDRWIVAHRGMTKSAILARKPFFLVHSSVTGIVAAEDWVPIAVM